MKDARDVVLRPVISEKSYAQIDNGKYTFEVAKTACKEEIRKSVEEIFKIHVTAVNTVTVHGKRKRRGFTSGMTKTWKKAIITVREGDRIEAFEAR
ncbi:MAG: 50S ribosomal protein L23 [Rubrobacteridae bacterium]|nr:50S ribosomal protein L23 [Rubrobacteridae bacterium]